MSQRRAYQERQYQERSVRRNRRFKIVAVMIVLGISVLAFAAITADRLFRPGAFPIQELRLEGEFLHLAPDELRETIVNEVGDNYFSLDLDQIERVAEQLPWVRKATVQRSWPHGLTVKVEEQHPVARWGAKHWLNSDAEVLHFEALVDAQSLIRLSGPEGSAREVWRNYNNWLPETRDLGLRIMTVELSDSYAWNIQVQPENGELFSILMGSHELDQRWNRFVKAYRVFLEAQTEQLISVDLRYPNGIAVRKREQQNDQTELQNTGLNG